MVIFRFILLFCVLENVWMFKKKRIIFAAAPIFTLYLNTVSLRAQSTLIGQLSQAREGAAHSQMARLKGTDSQCGLCTC